MAFIRGGGGGGAETPTLIWTNPNPNALFSVDTQVNYDTALYKYIVIEYYQRVTTAPNVYFRVGFDRVINNGGRTGLISNDYIRPITFNSNGLVIFRSSYQYDGSVTDTAYNIPLKIYGLKKLPYKIN